MRRSRQAFEPITMGHIRSHGVTRLLVYRGNAVWCHHSAELDGDFLPDETQLTPLCRRMVCIRCGVHWCGRSAGLVTEKKNTRLGRCPSLKARRLPLAGGTTICSLRPLTKRLE
jgi:hypothetical protein